MCLQATTTKPSYQATTTNIHAASSICPYVCEVVTLLLHNMQTVHNGCVLHECLHRCLDASMYAAKLQEHMPLRPDVEGAYLSIMATARQLTAALAAAAAEAAANTHGAAAAETPPYTILCQGLRPSDADGAAALLADRAALLRVRRGLFFRCCRKDECWWSIKLVHVHAYK